MLLNSNNEEHRSFFKIHFIKQSILKIWKQWQKAADEGDIPDGDFAFAIEVVRIEKGELFDYQEGKFLSLESYITFVESEIRQRLLEYGTIEQSTTFCFDRAKCEDEFLKGSLPYDYSHAVLKELGVDLQAIWDNQSYVL